MTRRLHLLAALVLGGLALALPLALAAPAQADPLTSRTTTGQTTTAQVTGQVTSQVADRVASRVGVPQADVSGPGGPVGPSRKGDGDVTVRLDGLTDKPSTSVTTILALTLLSLLPAIVLTCTSFTKILVVLSLTRNALGLQQTPPNQVLAGLALFLSLFIMSPVLSSMNDEGVRPYMDGTKTAAQAWDDGSAPLKAFMLDNTEDAQLELLTNVAKRDLPKDRAETPLSTLVPAFVLSELKQAFTIGFIIFIPFLVIDIVVSGALMALGMMMMPPVMVSLPFKLLLFVLVDGWALLIKALVASYG
ncbi:flagellar biosynthetic protein FliP [Nocardioides scoriae]|uniref:Flagellar biosynthetic protein FliP n=1 Tax=Nocardioides scoriae TaxID=642780 RepID=A0A1H1S8T1_9ACTN|nr:flagellar type III secretion system pore protein FliP [Nocardioides scoriae]SDS44208.1 flagellar biosynthetic protein FliP [Nocardioides scoriae]